MNSPDELPRLRMAPRETAGALERRLERERELELRRRERELEEVPLAPLRIGSVPYLNAVPLTRGIEDQIVLAAPSALAQMLREGKIDAALVSITEVLLHDAYEVLDGIAVASLGEVKSVFLAHRRSLEELDTIHCDTASLTSVNLLRVLLAERGLKPQFVPLADYANAPYLDGVLLIGDPAIRFARERPAHTLWDLGEAWYELTRLPFVYAVWALRRDVDTAAIRRVLRDAASFGRDTLDYIISSRTEFDLEFRKDYLGWHIHFHLGPDEKKGIQKFMELLRRHGNEPVYEPRFVS
ncbi:MAG TPA: menaquinone biosynthesis protein [Methylomirabilota bacterium]|nr:menaquinone biosynthesis protein [Methylomirabilota bacterium]